MPLQQGSNTTYYKIDPKAVVFYTGDGDTRIESNNYAGYLTDVDIHEFEHGGDTIEKLQLTFKDSLDTDASKEQVSFGIDTVAASGVINALMNIDGQYGKIGLGLWKPDGERWIACYVRHNGEDVDWKWSHEQVTEWAKQNYGGDRGAFFKDALVKKLKPKLAQQGTLASTGTTETTTNGTQPKVQDTPEKVTEETLEKMFDGEKIDDELPF